MATGFVAVQSQSSSARCRDKRGQERGHGRAWAVMCGGRAVVGGGRSWATSGELGALVLLHNHNPRWADCPWSRSERLPQAHVSRPEHRTAVLTLLLSPTHLHLVHPPVYLDTHGKSREAISLVLLFRRPECQWAVHVATDGLQKVPSSKYRPGGRANEDSRHGTEGGSRSDDLGPSGMASARGNEQGVGPHSLVSAPIEIGTYPHLHAHAHHNAHTAALAEVIALPVPAAQPVPARRLSVPSQNHPASPVASAPGTTANKPCQKTVAVAFISPPPSPSTSTSTSLALSLFSFPFPFPSPFPLHFHLRPSLAGSYFISVCAVRPHPKGAHHHHHQHTHIAKSSQ